MKSDPRDLLDADLSPLPEEQEEELARALRAAFAPAELDPAVNEALIAAALEDPLAPPTEEEVAESARLRDALEGRGEHPAADLARALSAAASPGRLDDLALERVATRTVGRRKSRGRIVTLAFGTTATAALALAASWFLVIAPALHDRGPELEALAVSRSTAGMFPEKFEPGTTTARVDRIALARSRELRSNRYALWGVR